MPGETTDARKRRQPEIEQSPTVLRADLDWMTQVADAAMENHRRADAKRVEAERRLLIAQEVAAAEAGELEHARARVTRLEHALRQAVIDIRDEMAPENIIRALEHADTGADHD